MSMGGSHGDGTQVNTEGISVRGEQGSPDVHRVFVF